MKPEHLEQERVESHRISIIGCGPGSLDYLPPIARKRIESADVLVGAARLLGDFAYVSAEKIPVRSDIPAVLEVIEERFSAGKKLVVLVTGDPGLCSFARPVLRKFGIGRCRVYPGISSVQAAFAAIGEDWYEAKVVSAHDGEPSFSPEDLVEEKKLAVLAGNPRAAEWVEALARRLSSSHRIVVCENLTLPEERVREVEEIQFSSLASRCVLLFIKKEKP